MTEENKFIPYTPEEGQLVLGPVIHVLLYERLRAQGILDAEDLQGWVVSNTSEDNKDSHSKRTST